MSYSLTKKNLKRFINEEVTGNVFIDTTHKRIMSRTPLGVPDVVEQPNGYSLYPSYYLNVLVNLHLGNIDRSQARWMLKPSPARYIFQYGDDFNPLKESKYKNTNPPQRVREVIPNFEWFECWGDATHAELFDFQAGYETESFGFHLGSGKLGVQWPPIPITKVFRKLSKPIKIENNPDYNTEIYILDTDGERVGDPIRYNRISLEEILEITKKSSPGYFYYLDGNQIDQDYRWMTQKATYTGVLATQDMAIAHLSKRFNIMFGAGAISYDPTTNIKPNGLGPDNIMSELAAFHPDGAKLRPFILKTVAEEDRTDYHNAPDERRQRIYSRVSVPLFYFIKKDDKIVTIKASDYNYLYTGEMNLPRVGISKQLQTKIKERKKFRYRTVDDRNVEIELPIGENTIKAEHIPTEDVGKIKEITVYNYPNIDDRAFFGNKSLKTVDLTYCGPYLGTEAFGLSDNDYNDEYDAIGVPGNPTPYKDDIEGLKSNSEDRDTYQRPTGMDLPVNPYNRDNYLSKRRVIFGMGIKEIGDDIFKNQWLIFNPYIPTYGDVKLGSQSNWVVVASHAIERTEDNMDRAWTVLSTRGVIKQNMGKVITSDGGMDVFYNDKTKWTVDKTEGTITIFDADNAERTLKAYIYLGFANSPNRDFYTSIPERVYEYYYPSWDTPEENQKSPTELVPLIEELETKLDSDKTLMPSVRVLLELYAKHLKFLTIDPTSTDVKKLVNDKTIFDIPDSEFLTGILLDTMDVFGVGVTVRHHIFDGMISKKSSRLKGHFDEWKNGEIFAVDRAIY